MLSSNIHLGPQDGLRMNELSVGSHQGFTHQLPGRATLQVLLPEPFVFSGFSQEAPLEL